MGTANDKKVLALKAMIQEKKNKIEKIKFVSLTNCSIELDGVRYNILTLNRDHLTFLLIKLNMYWLSMKDLGVEVLIISGYTVQDWITDIQLKLKALSQKVEEDTLKTFELKLEMLLSEDKKTELELSSMESFLNS